MRSSFQLLIVCMLFLLSSCVAAQQVFYVSTNGSNADGKSWASAWNELNQINWRVVEAGATIYLDGGTTDMVYRTTLSVEKGGREGQPIRIERSLEAGRNGKVVIFGGRSVDLPYCGQASFKDSSGSLRNVGIHFAEVSWVSINGMDWRGISIHGHNGSGIESRGQASHVSLKNLEVYNNGSVRTLKGQIQTDDPGLRLSGKHISVERTIIHDNGQDAIQARSLSDFSLREAWLYNSKPHPTIKGESWNYCTHADGMQLFDGGALANFLIEDSIIGPGLTNGLILGQLRDREGNEATLSNVTLRNLIFSKAAENAILSYPKTQNTNWTLDKLTVYCDNTKFHCLSLEGSNHAISNSIFYGSRLTILSDLLANSNNCEWNTIGNKLGFLKEPIFNQVFADPFSINDDYSLTSSSSCLGAGSDLVSVSQLLGLSAAAFSVSSVASWEAEEGDVVFPFESESGGIVQFLELLDPALAGRSVYPFKLEEAGEYVVVAIVDAPSEGENSLFISINSEPEDLSMVWDIEPTQGYEERLASWRGSGSFDNNEFSPKVFRLDTGEHELLITAREANVRIDKVALVPLDNLDAN